MRTVAEWQRQAAIFILWPYRRDVWRDAALPVQQELVDWIADISHQQRCVVGVLPRLAAAVAKLLRCQLSTAQQHRVGLWLCHYDDAWPRDLSPTWMVDQAQRYSALCWRFDAWGGLYPNYARDQSLALRVAQAQAVQPVQQTLVFEGGALSHDGYGTALMARACIQRLAASSGLSANCYQQALQRRLRLRQLVCLDGFLSGDETLGHVDNVALFIDSQTLLVSLPESTEHPDQAALKENFQRLQGLRNCNGERYRVVALPQPQLLNVSANSTASIESRPGVLSRAQRPLLASYVNCLRSGRQLWVPQFGLSSDAQALTRLQEALPSLDIRPVRAIEMIRGGGGLHCMSEQLLNWPTGLTTLSSAP
ncbi:agmatine deiminase family protein [Idiomarina xiamenensis]|uniref:agmatine deiminase family protein n=1 Tax=Idiomarina xiamenensis TaxID=1207041 RepID=UPI00178C25E3|nr:agmatine deiminase family protein [Idiomarina xiamenensis]